MFETCLYYSSAKCTCVVLIRVLHTFPEFNPIYHGTRSERAWKFQISSDQITFPRELPIFCMIAQKETTVYRELLVEWMFRLLRVATKKSAQSHCLGSVFRILKTIFFASNIFSTICIATFGDKQFLRSTSIDDIRYNHITSVSSLR